MSGYSIVSLYEILKKQEISHRDVNGKDIAKSIIATFSCPMNKDIQYFVDKSMILFEEQRISSTYLVMASYRKQPVLVGFFTLSPKSICIKGENISSNSMKRRIGKFSQYDNENKAYFMPVILIGQLSKNYASSYNKLITGDELLKFAFDKAIESQKLTGGRYIYLESEDKEYLKQFYQSNGFVEFGRRKLDREETDMMEGKELIQFLKYMHY